MIIYAKKQHQKETAKHCCNCLLILRAHFHVDRVNIVTIFFCILWHRKDDTMKFIDYDDASYHGTVGYLLRWPKILFQTRNLSE